MTAKERFHQGQEGFTIQDMNAAKGLLKQGVEVVIGLLVMRELRRLQLQ